MQRISISLILISLCCAILTTSPASHQPRSESTAALSEADTVEHRADLLLDAKLGQTVAVGDFDGDGLPDTAATDFLSDSLWVRLAASSEKPRAFVRLVPGAGPRAVVAGDFDRDGSSDLAVANFFSGDVALYDVRGVEATVVKVGEGLASVVTADFDSDGIPDLATANFYSGDLALWKGMGDGSFRVSRIGWLHGVTLLLTADREGRGVPDLIAFDFSGSRGWIFSNNGRGEFGSDLTLSTDQALGLREGQRDNVRSFRESMGVEMPFYLPEETYFDLIRDSLRDSILARDVRVSALLEYARRGLRSDPVGAVRSLVDSMVILRDPDRSNAPGGGRTATTELGKRLIDQVLLIGAGGGAASSSEGPDPSNSPAGAAGQASSPGRGKPRPPVVCDGTLTCDVPLTDTIETLGDTDHFCFEAAAGERVQINLVSTGTIGGSFTPVWQLLDSSGQPASTCGGNNFGARDCGPLTAAGSPYTIRVSSIGNAGTGTYLMALQRLTAASACETVSAACDTRINGAIDSVVESDLFRFTAADGEMVEVRIRSTGFDAQWRLLDSSGVPASSCGSFDFSTRDCGPLTVAGSPYSIHVSDWGSNQTGTYQLALQRLTAATACDITHLACDTAANGTIDSEVGSDLLRFSVAGGERIHISVAGTGTTSGNYAPAWRLLDFGGYNVSFYCAGGTFFHGALDCGPLPAAGSPYSIHVIESGGDGTGTYQVALQRLTAATACDATGIACDVPVSGTIDGVTESDLFRFGAVDGERVFINLLRTGTISGNFVPSWRLLDSSGAPVSSFCGSFQTVLGDCGPLSAAGSPYSIQVNAAGNSGTGTYQLEFQRLSSGTGCNLATLACDIPVDRTLDSPVESDLFRFNASDGERVQINVARTGTLSGNFRPIWRLLDAAGIPVSYCGFGVWYLGALDCGPLDAAGSPYSIQVFQFGTEGSGTYQIALQRLTAATTCEAVALTCDVSTSGTIDGFAESDLFQFSAASGERVHIKVAWTSTISGNFHPTYRLLDSSGRLVLSCSSSDCGPLSAAGNPYFIQVLDWEGDGAGTYELGFQRLTSSPGCEIPPLACDVPVAGVFDQGVDSDLYQFAAVEGEKVQISFARTGTISGFFDPRWRLLDAAGTPVSHCQFLFSSQTQLCGPLPAAGSPYSIQVYQVTGAGTGTYEIVLQRLTAATACENTTLACDVPVTGSIDSVVDTDLFRFTVDSGEILRISLRWTWSSGNFGPEWRVLDSSGTGASGPCDPGAGTCGPLSPSGNPYSIQVFDRMNDGTGSYQLALQRVTSGFSCDVTPLVCGVPSSATIGYTPGDGGIPGPGSVMTPIDTDLFSFSVNDGEVVKINAIKGTPSSPTFNPAWHLLTAAGIPAPSCGSPALGERDCGPLAASGNPYRVLVESFGSGAYQILVQYLTTGCQPCGYNVSPTSFTFPGTGGNGTVNVQSGGHCSWNAYSRYPWIRITQGQDGSGNGPVQFTVDPNPGPGSRMGWVVVAGVPVVINQ